MCSAVWATASKECDAMIQMHTQQARLHGGAIGPRRTGGFTLIELLVVVAIIALLISILLPSLQSAREQAKTTTCAQSLHQLGLSVQYYVDENMDRLPFIRGAQGQNGCTVAPFRQYDMIFNLWRYQKDMKIYQCPSAVGKKSSVENSILVPPGQQGISPGYYSALAEDDRWVNEARAWFPHFDVQRDTRSDGAGDLVIPSVSTEYWFNDFNSPSVTTGQPCVRELNPLTGRQEYLPNVNGGRVSALPVSNQTMTFADAWHTIPRERHQGGKNVLFLDAHVERMPRLRTLDCVSVRAGNQARQDVDTFGNAPYWYWGLTRFGVRIDPGCTTLLAAWEDY
jgi:prepilin-type N-terminal cleavage/methylation domain-containing protein/prepilin-type processing-associated H-X9-DG protein